MEKVAAHIAEFSPRLRSNARALYQCCAIPAVRYPQLDEELFCNIFYLRHLCDTTRFPDWPISEPVSKILLVVQLLPLCCYWRKRYEHFQCFVL
jgi:DnaJ family protein C protein 13